MFSLVSLSLSLSPCLSLSLSLIVSLSLSLSPLRLYLDPLKNSHPSLQPRERGRERGGRSSEDEASTGERGEGERRRFGRIVRLSPSLTLKRSTKLKTTLKQEFSVESTKEGRNVLVERERERADLAVDVRDLGEDAKGGEAQGGEEEKRHHRNRSPKGMPKLFHGLKEGEKSTVKLTDDVRVLVGCEEAHNLEGELVAEGNGPQSILFRIFGDFC